MQLVRIFDLHEGHILGESITYEKKGKIALLNKYDLITYKRLGRLQKSYDSEYLVKVLTNKEVYNAIHRNKPLVEEFIDDLSEDTSSDILSFNLCSEYFSTFKQHVIRDDTLLDLIIRLINKHDYTFRHSLNVGYYNVLLGVNLGFNQKELLELLIGGILHDIGKLRIPTSILDKPGSLNDYEYDEIHKHPNYGLNEVTRLGLKTTENIRCIIGQHHEANNGSGYPNKLTTECINKLAQVTAITDKYDAIHSDRAYHIGKSPEKTISILQDMSDANMINKDYFDVFREIMLEF